MQQNFSSLTPPGGRSPSRRVLCLCGFMGCGKTTVGALLARHLGWRFEDLDARIEQAASLSIPAIFDQMGEPAFRALETKQLEAVLGHAAESHEPFVLALGGGTYAQPGTAERLRASGVVAIWLDCPIELLLSRCATMTNRPLFRDEPSFRNLLAVRLPFYAQADDRVPGGGDPSRIVEEILALPSLQRLTGLRDQFPLRQGKA